MTHTCGCGCTISKNKAHRDDPFHMHYYQGFDGSLRTRSLDSVLDQQQWLDVHALQRIRAALRIERSDRVFVTAARKQCDSGDRPASCRRRWQVLATRGAFDASVSSRAEHGAGYATKMSAPETAEPLPARLRDVLAGLVRGEAEKQIARRLGLSPNTVNRHVQRLYRRFEVRSRGELMFQLLKRGLE